ncbi:hypothetical protein DFH08DRAFT_896240 [Mycena albidolilacea]|uniref:Uncharacterized protein n=1 Tax=Mycena albidolilacea TaxID=1033008 RepID=A0AAD6ZAB3_9AGAR|nr:hypothetical protein DFH08DRAFT_896240 [Mycena albidolilacea]
MSALCSLFFTTFYWLYSALPMFLLLAVFCTPSPNCFVRFTRRPLHFPGGIIGNPLHRSFYATRAITFRAITFGFSHFVPRHMISPKRII